MKIECGGVIECGIEFVVHQELGMKIECGGMEFEMTQMNIKILQLHSTVRSCNEEEEEGETPPPSFEGDFGISGVGGVMVAILIPCLTVVA